jgi:L-ribulose-5-phosphate 4-epimerase
MEDQRKELLRITRQSYEEHLFAGTSGNLSTYDPESGIMAITPASVAYETMGLAEIVLMDLDGQVYSGHRKPSTEWRMHAAIYRERSDVRAVIHTHSPYAMVLAVQNENLPAILTEMVYYLGGEICVAPFTLPGTPEMGAAAVGALHSRGGCLLQNHGAVTIGETLEQAHLRAVYLEDAAKV